MKLINIVCSLATIFTLTYSSILFADNSNSLKEKSDLNQVTAVLTYSQLPVNLQLFARDNQDSAAVTFAGKMFTTGLDSMYLEVYKNNVYLNRKCIKLNYTMGVSLFTLIQKIHAELSEYKFKLYYKVGTVSTLINTVDSVVCGDAFIICGQSNSTTPDPAATYTNEFCRSFGIQTANYNNDPYNPTDTNWQISNADGANTLWPGTSNVGVWGLQLQKLIKENFGIPTCVINGGKGGSTIGLNLRNDYNQLDLNSIYGKILYRVTKSGLANNIKAIFWYQGESNGDLSWQNYFNNFQDLYNSWKENYPNFKKIFLFQTRPCCSDQYASQLREVQRKLPVTFPEIELMSTAGTAYYEGCHYQYNGYTKIANMIFSLVSKRFYSISDTVNMRPPNIKFAYYTTALKNEIALIFENSPIAAWPADTLGQSMKNYFYLNGVFGNVSYGTVSGDTLKLQLNNTSSATKITYLTSVWNYDDSLVYEGPFLRNPKRIGALSFYDFPIANYAPTTIDVTLAIEGYFNASTNKLNIRDTVTILLRNNFYPYLIRDSARANIDSVSLTGRFIFGNVSTGTYYLVVKSKNSLETWSKSGGVSFSAGANLSYNFTTSAAMAYGNNLRLKGSKYCIYSSDINQDGITDASDMCIISNDASGIFIGYINTDLNGDRIVDGSDVGIADINASLVILKRTP